MHNYNNYCSCNYRGTGHYAAGHDPDCLELMTLNDAIRIGDEMADVTDMDNRDNKRKEQ